MAMSVKKTQGWIICLVGLPGAGKSTYGKAVCHALEKDRIDFRYLSMDEQCDKYIPNRKYTSDEREIAYTLFANEAILLSRDGINVVMDATAPKLAMRKYIREKIKHFAEIYICCPLETAIVREELKYDGLVIAGLYDQALLRKEKGVRIKGPGTVVGIDSPFEDGELQSISEAPKATHEHHFYPAYRAPDIEGENNAKQETWWYKNGPWVWLALFLLVASAIVIVPCVGCVNGWWGL